jgi:hypothetical protein
VALMLLMDATYASRKAEVGRKKGVQARARAPCGHVLKRRGAFERKMDTCVTKRSCEVLVCSLRRPMQKKRRPTEVERLSMSSGLAEAQRAS